MAIQPPTDLVLKFWAFFSQISNDLAFNPDNSLVIESLDKEVKQLGDFDWEYGPLENEDFMSITKFAERVSWSNKIHNFSCS